MMGKEKNSIMCKYKSFQIALTVTGGVLLEKVFLNISQNSKKNTCNGFSV